MALAYLTVLSIDSALMFTDIQPQGSVARGILVSKITFFIVILLRERYNKRTLGIISILIICAIASYLTTGYTYLASAIMTGVVFQKLDYKKGFKYLFFIRLSLMLIVNVFSLVGVFDICQRVVIKSYGTVVGYGLGYNHPNRYAYSYIFLQMTLICWKNNRIKWNDYFIISLIGGLGYSITKSRTLLVVTIILLFVILMYRNPKTNEFVKGFLKKTAVLIYPILAILSLVIPFLIATSNSTLSMWLKKINYLLSYRFSIIPRVFEFYRVTLFGGIESFALLNQKYNYSTIDNGYIRLLFGFGIMGIAVFMTMFVVSIWKLQVRGEYIYIICAITTAAWGLSENIIMYDSFNISILFWGIVFIKTQTRLTKAAISVEGDSQQ